MMHVMVRDTYKNRWRPLIVEEDEDEEKEAKWTRVSGSANADIKLGWSAYQIIIRATASHSGPSLSTNDVMLDSIDTWLANLLSRVD